MTVDQVIQQNLRLHIGSLAVENIVLSARLENAQGTISEMSAKAAQPPEAAPAPANGE